MVAVQTWVRERRYEGAEVDPEDMDLYNLCKWTLDSQGYMRGSVGGKFVRLHRLIATRMYGELSDHQQVDHRDGRRARNLRKNLRVATPQQNQWNRRTRKGPSGYTGVKQIPASGNWRAFYTKDNKHTHLGVFATKEEAAVAYNTATRQDRGEFAALNDVPEGITPVPIARRKGRFPGVRSKGDKWTARIKVKGVEHYLGTFDTREDAMVARQQFVERNCRAS